MTLSRWGTAPWRISGPASAEPPPAACDVLVIGGGLTGLAAAYALARAGVSRIAVVEAERIGAGASGRTGGIALEGTAIGSLPGVDSCLDTLAALVRDAGIDCNLQLRGCLELEHVDPGSPSDGSRLWKDGDRVLRVCDSVPGGTIDPGRLVSGIARAARRAGVSIHEGTAAHRVDTASPLTVETTTGTVRAEYVLLATNGYMPSLLSIPRPFDSALTIALCTDPIDSRTIAAIGWSDGRPFYTVDLPYLWGRPLDDGRVILGAGLAFHPSGDPRAIDIHEGDAAAATRRLTERLRGLHPALGGVGISAAWGGPIAIARGRPPLLGWHPAVSRFLVAGGYSGHGVALSVRVAELAADAIAAGRTLPDWGKLPPGTSFAAASS